MEVPVLILDLDETEAAKLLAVHDPLVDMADANQEILQELLARVETENDAVQSLLDEMRGEPEPLAGGDDEDGPHENVAIPESFQVVVECRDEAEQQTLFERLAGEGFKCRLLML